MVNRQWGGYFNPQSMPPQGTGHGIPMPMPAQQIGGISAGGTQGSDLVMKRLLAALRLSGYFGAGSSMQSVLQQLISGGGSHASGGSGGFGGGGSGGGGGGGGGGFGEAGDGMTQGIGIVNIRP